MENGTNKWGFEDAENGPDTTTTITIKGLISLLMANIDEGNNKRLISLGMGDPSVYTCFHTSHVATESVVDAVESNKYNGYAPTSGLPQARKAIAEYLSRDLPYKLSLDDVFITSGCTQAIDVALSILARPGANILIPNPGFPIYQLSASFRGLEVRFYDLLPEKGWEADLDAIKALADQNTVALVIINPNNPCGSVYSYQHLKKIVERLKKYFDILGGPATFIQAAVPRIMEQTDGTFFKKTINLLKQASDICLEKIQEIPCITCPHKPEGSMAVMVKLNLSLLEDINDDIDFCFKLAKEESVIILPGVAVGLKNWLRITFAADPSFLEEGLERIKSFYHRHSNIQHSN
ncbi:probable aminotransferase TAT2 isoform X2 [Vitis riparia]|uniref:probable aminotransferase TAT2 isoform X2 n=1 Tax=Vitis riparia TaxID=96939 RepID=UPI00155A58F6|nr:probable aminotransferase TAT2 isoform X2 [Vitis riparia]